MGLESSSSDLAAAGDKKGGEVSLWKDIQKSQEHALVLKDRDEIEKYVLSVVRGYFRTTKKAHLTLESQFADHGLDSLDAIEMVIQIEDELGYVIDAENLEKFKKPKHFVNFISHMEAYKNEFSKLPHENVHASFSLGDAFPGLPGTGKKKWDHSKTSLSSARERSLSSYLNIHGHSYHS